MLRLAAQSWVDGFPNLRFFRYAIVPLVVSLRGKSDDAKVTLFTSLILFFTGLLKPGSQNARTPPLDEKRRFWTRNKSRTKRRSSMFDFTLEPALDMLSFSKNIFISFDTLAAAHNTQILLA